MISKAEIGANIFNTVSIILAGRKNVHTWWTGIVGCALFIWVFFAARLYADVTLQVFFIVTCVAGWWDWQNAAGKAVLPIRRTSPTALAGLSLASVLVAVGYGFILRRFTNAFAPFADSLLLTFSVLGQFLLVDRRVENWWCWLFVNTISVPLYLLRGLNLTAALYVVYWINALVSLRDWRRVLATNRS